MSSRGCAGLLATLLVAYSAGAGGVVDAMRTPALRDVRLLGHPARKMNDLFRERITSPFAQQNVFGEARRAFVERDDDERGHGGYWKGEFWGKLMLGAARVADYLQDEGLLRFVREECGRMIALQDSDGYLGSYRDKDLVSITDPAATWKIYGWDPVWNIWNRKYAIWGMLMAYRTTHDKAILESVVRQVDQLFGMLARRGLRLRDTGTPSMNGLPSMSILKPLVMLYEDTGDERYLGFARDILADWDRDDGVCPNFFRNAKLEKPLHHWYPRPDSWAKTYEFLSCVDGLLEYYRVTGDRRCLDTASAIRENIAVSDANPFGSVGFGDKLIGAPRYCNGLNEVCDVIHWIRLNIDLFLITGEKRYLDSVEVAYFNGFLAGIWRGGAWGPFFIRGHGRHTDQKQCGCAYNHCCVNNLPRTFMDVASVAVTRSLDGRFHVNLYQDATVDFEGVRFAISGNYPVDNVVTVRVESEVAVRVDFRKPEWCPRMDVVRTGDEYVLTFDMNPRVVERLNTDPALNAKDPTNWAYSRYPDRSYNVDCQNNYRTKPAATVMWGPLLLARSRLIGQSRKEVLDDFSVNGKRSGVRAVRQIGGDLVWGCWRLELAVEGAPPKIVKVCDFESAGDMPVGLNGYLFSIWF